MRDIDYCENCGTEEGVEVFKDILVCHKCFKKLKKEDKLQERENV